MSDERIAKLHIELQTLENALEPEKETMKKWKDLVDDYSFDFVKSLETGKAYSYKNNKKFQSVEFDETPKSLESLIDLLKSEYNDSGINAASGGYMAFIGGGGLYPSSLGDYIAAVTNKYSGVIYGCPAAVDIENSIIKWVCKLIGYPVDDSTGNICSGSSTGILYSVNVAREAKNVKSQVYSKLVFYCTSVCHGCVFKAIKVGGLGDATIRVVPTDDRYMMVTSELENMIQNDLANEFIPFMVFSNAGSTDVGSVDPIYEIGQLARTYNIWHHVDAAYGGFFMLVESQRYKFKGIELADSVTVDPHKTLFMPYGCGIVLYRDSRAARAAFSVNCNCLQDTLNDEISPADVSVELTKNFRGLRIWLPLQMFGLKPFRSCLEEKILLTEYFYKSVQKIGYTVGPVPQLTVVIFRFIPKEGAVDAVNEELLEMLKRDGTVLLSSTRIDGAYWIRCGIVVFRTHLNHVDSCLRVLTVCYEKLKDAKKISGESTGTSCSRKIKHV
jgi:aromatic-L-amino-acid decarboxylase